ncbi:MAG TPA: tetratricopeptide repeat protein [Gammaproteobacteria bacterium]|nr:tetratricopeptide repeat protein [Gammaproteobacteria bacterium]
MPEPQDEQSAASVVTEEVSPLDDRLLFHVLSAELAGNQGDLRQSQQAYMDAARLSNDPRVAERAARLALYLHDPLAAQEASQRWQALAPDDPAPHEALALTLLRNDRMEQALDHLRTALRLQSGGVGSGFERIVALLARETGETKALALTAVEALVAEHAAEPQAYQAWAELALQYGQPELALKAAEQAKTLAPDWTAPELLLVQAHLKLEEGDKAVELLEQVLRRQPNDYDLRLQYARTLLGLEQAEGALQQFELLLKARPNDLQIRYVAALLSLELGENDKARTYLLQLVNSGQRSDDAYFYLGRLAQTEGDAKGALRWYRQVQGQYRPDALLRLAEVLAQQGQPAAAQAKLKEVRQQYPAYTTRSYLLEAAQLRDQGRLHDAHALYTEALQQQPDDIDLRYGRALTAVMLGQIDAAERDLRELLRRQPDEPILLNALGYTLVDQTTRYYEGLELIERAYALSPDNPAIMDSMGWALYRLQRLEEARELLLEAYGLSEDGEIAAHLAEVLWHLGDRHEARRILAEGLKREPGHKVLLDTRKRLR